jgi:predicted nucleic acid-binding protein
VKSLLDANVLYSITLTDVVLSLAEIGLFQPLWTEEILIEAERNLVEEADRRGGSRSAAIRRRFREMREAFSRALVATHDYAHLIPEMRNHEGDRHVLAAAVAARADVIVTANSRHFTLQSLTGLSVGSVATPDTFLCELHRAHPLLVEAIMDRMLAGKEQPRMTIPDLADRLVAAGTPAFAERIGLFVPIFHDR